MIEVSAPARICFYGDHQDYLDLPVIAGAINRFIHIKAIPNEQSEFRILLADLGEEKVISIHDALKNISNGDYFRSGISVLKTYGFKFKRGYTIEIHGTIPLNAGLSSSSALMVAWIRFLIAIQEEPKQVNNATIGQWAYEAEVVYFNQPGGLMDQYTIAQGGLLYINTKTSESTPLKSSLRKLVVAESGLPKRTLDVLKNARVYAQKGIEAVKRATPLFNLHKASPEDYEKYLNIVPEEFQSHWYATIFNYNITLKAKKELQKPIPDVEILGELMNQHQAILQENIQNTPVEMTKMMKAALKAGALGTKIIGSGGGGCMVALAKENQKEIMEAFMTHGAKAAYEVELTTIV
ncbi:GHMP kinase [Flagellimonas aquimarina]|uniref:GHMP kinase n=1 Tax=Flagellimonas aquimarina TaxID=2201895 RepID=A0A316KUN7_9FLAO|nr:galactokinase family protein [Allomuricauda koreensis]PWL37464.1 GHMP kinase [Allomuricauda koreensis]